MFRSTGRNDGPGRADPSSWPEAHNGTDGGRRCLRRAPQAPPAGDPRLSAAGREVLARITTGDLVDEFQASLDAYLEADPILGGHHDDTD